MKTNITQGLKAGFVVLVVAAVATTGVALAQTGDGTGTTGAPAVADDGGFLHGPRLGRGFRGDFDDGGARGFGGVVNELADATGLTVRDILDQLGNGSSVADIAAANGTSADAIVEDLLAGLSERLDAAVADERITADEAAAKLEGARDRLTTMVETPDPIGAALAERQARIEDQMVQRAEQQQALLDVLGMTSDELRAALMDGQTLGEIADAQGASVSDVVDVLIAPLAQNLDEKVAAGDLTQDEADQMLANATERATQSVENGGGLGFGPGRGGGRHGRGHGPGRGFGPGAGFDTGFQLPAGATIDA